jgi:hypothetical protein
MLLIENLPHLIREANLNTIKLMECLMDWLGGKSHQLYWNKDPFKNILLITMTKNWILGEIKVLVRLLLKILHRIL